MRLFNRPKLRLERIPVGINSVFVLFVDRGKDTMQLKTWADPWEDGGVKSKHYSKNLSVISGIKLIDNTHE